MTMPAVDRAWSRFDTRHREQALGIFFIFTVAVIWVAASFLVQNLEQQGINPVVLTYIANSLFIVLIPVSILSPRKGSGTQPRFASAGRHQQSLRLVLTISLQHCQRLLYHAGL